MCSSDLIKISDAEMNAINIDRDPFHGEWNYTIIPMIAVANRPVSAADEDGLR